MYTRERHAKLRSNGRRVSDEEITMAVAGFHPQVALIEQLRPGLERTDERRVGDDGGRTGLRAFSSGSLNGWSMRRKNSDPYGSEHKADNNGELLGHLLMSDIFRSSLPESRYTRIH